MVRFGRTSSTRVNLGAPERQRFMGNELLLCYGDNRDTPATRGSGDSPKKTFTEGSLPDCPLNAASIIGTKLSSTVPPPSSYRINPRLPPRIDRYELHSFLFGLACLMGYDWY